MELTKSKSGEAALRDLARLKKSSSEENFRPFDIKPVVSPVQLQEGEGTFRPFGGRSERVNVDFLGSGTNSKAYSIDQEPRLFIPGIQKDPVVPMEPKVILIPKESQQVTSEIIRGVRVNELAERAGVSDKIIKTLGTAELQIEGSQRKGLVIERANGIPLEKLGKFEPSEAVAITRQYAEFESKASKQGFSYADAHPGNLFIDKEKDRINLKLIDIGGVQFHEDAKKFFGHVDHMAPVVFGAGSYLPATAANALSHGFNNTASSDEGKASFKLMEEQKVLSHERSGNILFRALTGKDPGLDSLGDSQLRHLVTPQEKVAVIQNERFHRHDFKELNKALDASNLDKKTTSEITEFIRSAWSKNPADKLTPEATVEKLNKINGLIKESSISNIQWHD